MLTPILLILALTPVERIKAGERYVHVPLGRYELTETLEFQSGQTVLCEPGAEFVAAAGRFQGVHDSLVRIRGSQVTVVGCGFRMDKAAYTLENGYPDSEFRHCVHLEGATAVTLSGITTTNCGGDGVCIDPRVEGPHTENRFPSRDIELDRLEAKGCLRTGLAVISCVNLWVHDSRFLESFGKPTQSGVNLEPSHAGDCLQGIKVERCLSRGHGGSSFMVNLDRQTERSKPVSITFTDCVGEEIPNQHHLIRVLEYGSNQRPWKPLGEIRFGDSRWTNP